MNLHKLIFTENACYQAGKKITVKGIMVHSTGANNPWLKRYVEPPKPDDTADALAIAVCHAHSGVSRLAQY